jgi:hypothetical protein
MVLLRGPKPDDYDIELATRKGNYIPNLQGSNAPYGQMQRFLEKYKKALPQAIPQIVDGFYNCTGMVLAARRTIIEVRHTRWILEDYGYRRLSANEKPGLGDIVLYADVEQELTHVGVITEYKSLPDKPGEFETWVRSKWGATGAEYLHPINHVPDLYGRPVEYWRHGGHI